MDQIEEKEDGQEDTSSLIGLVHNYYCGICKWRPKSLQVLVTAKFFVPLLCFNTLLQSAYVNGKAIDSKCYYWVVFHSLVSLICSGMYHCQLGVDATAHVVSVHV